MQPTHYYHGSGSEAFPLLTTSHVLCRKFARRVDCIEFDNKYLLLNKLLCYYLIQAGLDVIKL